MLPESSTLLREQLDYYRARATEYDEWWLRLGRYDRGTDLNLQWAAEGATVSAALAKFRPAGRVLEFACGTGIWTEQLVRTASHVTALDGSPEMLAINKARVHSPLVEYGQADLFQWRPAGQYDVVFFGFWLSHVPPERFEEFWELVRRSLAPGGRVFFVDSRCEPTSVARDHGVPKSDATVQLRKLNDGREFHVFKLFYEAAALQQRLAGLGWRFALRETEHYFLFGEGERSA